MKTLKKIVRLMLVAVFTIVIALSATSCSSENKEYTPEEHIARIRDLTDKRFQYHLENMLIENIYVDIIYSLYTEKPLYFLVEIEYKEAIVYGTYCQDNKNIDYSTKYKHVIGYIENNNYYLGLQDIGVDFIKCRSPYTYYEHFVNKKYYGDGVYAVKYNDSINAIFTITQYYKSSYNVEYGATNENTERRILDNGERLILENSTLKELKKPYYTE